MSPATVAEPKSKSTGPRTEEGKKRSAMNATRHGLTGRTVVIPYEDMEAYHAFCKHLFGELAPETPLERQYAQNFCDTQWRLSRARSIEDSMFSLGHFEAAREASKRTILKSTRRSRPPASSAMIRNPSSTSASTSSVSSARSDRIAETAAQALQAERRARPQSERQAVSEAREPEQPRARQFVFSNPEIEAELHRRLLLEEAQNAGQYIPARKSTRFSGRACGLTKCLIGASYIIASQPALYSGIASARDNETVRWSKNDHPNLTLIVYCGRGWYGASPELRPRDAKNAGESEPEDWLMYSRTYDAQRFSPLKQIDRQKSTASHGLDSRSRGGTTETIPIVHNGVMYLGRSGGRRAGLRRSPGDLLWEYKRPVPANVAGLRPHQVSRHLRKPHPVHAAGQLCGRAGRPHR